MSSSSDLNALLDQGLLGEAISRLGEQLQSSPSNVHARTALFELLCFAGEFDRAERQLAVLGMESPVAAASAGILSRLLQAERERFSMCRGQARPRLLGPSAEWAEGHLDALGALGRGESSAARVALEEAIGKRSAVSGTLDGTPFEDLQDSDDFVGPFLEIFTQEGYLWLPFAEISALDIQPPRHQRDLLWARGRLVTQSGSEQEVFLPALYAGSSAHPDPRVKLGQATEWSEVGSGLFRGVGQRLLLVDGEERPFLEVRELKIQCTGDV